MANAFAQLRNIITETFSAPLLVNGSKTAQATTNGKTDDVHPCVGFKATFNPTNHKLTVNVIGARHLPASVGNIPAVGYLVKVKLFPGKDKFETEIKPESWPRFDEKFDFQITPNKPSQYKTLSEVEMCLVASKFVTLTVLAVDKNDKRKSVGSVTWPLDHKLFKPKKFNNAILETPDTWRRVAELTTNFQGLTAGLQQKLVPRCKDQVEVTLCHTIREVGDDDLLAVKLNRLRWSIDKTKEYEHKNAMLYVKMSVTNSFGQIVRCQKTLQFTPSISVHWPPDDVKYSALEAPIPILGSKNRGMSCVLTLCTKIKGKKIHLGRAVIVQIPVDSKTDDDHWGAAMQTPGIPVTQWHNLLSVES